MPSVTVSGGTGVTLDLHYSSRSDAQIARTLAETIDKAIANGGMVASTNVAHAPQPPAGTVGEVVRTTSGMTILNAADTAAVVTASHVVLVDGGAQGQTVLSGSGSLTYLAQGGSGEIVAGGPLDFVGSSVGGGDWAIHAGAGNDVIFAGTGNDTIGLGGRNNLVLLGSGNSVVTFAGKGGGHDDSGEARQMRFIGGENGDGESGGDENGRGGSMFVRGEGDQMHRASSGNESLDGAQGGGQNQVYLGSGNATVGAGAGQTLAIFVKGDVGGADVLQNFSPGQNAKVELDGYGRNEIANALATQTTVAGNTTVTLSDNTKITFTDVSHVTRSFFG
jgi:hypothetical protein